MQLLLRKENKLYYWRVNKYCYWRVLSLWRRHRDNSYSSSDVLDTVKLLVQCWLAENTTRHHISSPHFPFYLPQPVEEKSPLVVEVEVSHCWTQNHSLCPCLFCSSSPFPSFLYQCHWFLQVDFNILFYKLEKTIESLYYCTSAKCVWMLLLAAVTCSAHPLIHSGQMYVCWGNPWFQWKFNFLRHKVVQVYITSDLTKQRPLE